MSENRCAPPITFRFYLNERYGPNICYLFRQLESNYKKLACAENGLTFMCRCRQHDIIPKGLRLKLPYDSMRCTRILKRASQAMVRERIQFHRFNKRTHGQIIEDIQKEIERNVSFIDFNHIYSCVKNSYHLTFSSQKQTHTRKFQNLIRERHEQELVRINNDFVGRTVINLSDRNLSTSENLILSKGLNFALTPKTVPKIDFITSIEETAQHLSDDVANEYRVRTKIELEKHIKIKPNITTDEKMAIRSLKTDNSIKILPADKGNATVIMSTDSYNQKVMALINEATYSKLNKDPTKSIENKIYRTLKKHENQFTNIERRKLTPHFSKPPHFYGLPKIHKINIPLRPIISSINSPCHPLAKFLLNILNPLAGNTNSYIKNSKHFLEKLSNIEINNQFKMVSFDVVSLFTNVPVDKTLNIIRNKLENDDTLNQRSKLNVDTILELLTICIKTTYFQLGNEFYQQNSGMAMGSPLSPIISNIFMEDFEHNIIENYNHKPTIWWRYVDDIFAVWPHDITEIYEFLNYINDKEDTIKFTLEVERENQIPFLDILIKKTIHNTIETNVYRKPTHTNRYLNYNSNHNTAVKKGIIKCLYDRAKNICSNNENFNNEKTFITKVLTDNNYPKNFIDNTIYEIETSHNNNNPINNPTIPIKPISLTIPYVRGLSDKINRIGKRFNIRTIFKTKDTLRSILTNTKPENAVQKSKDCIYHIACECGKFYIGETGRPLEVRVSEHKNYIKSGNFHKSNICQHAWDNNHRIVWDSARIILKESATTKRKLKESAIISLKREQCIASCSVDINNLWLPILRTDMKLDRFNLGA